MIGLSTAQLGGTRWLVDVLGIEGISAGVLVLLGVALYVHRAAAVASTATTVAATGANTVKATAALLALFVGLGVFEWNRRQTVSVTEQLHTFVTTHWTTVMEFLQGLA